MRKLLVLGLLLLALPAWAGESGQLAGLRNLAIQSGGGSSRSIPSRVKRFA